MTSAIGPSQASALSNTQSAAPAQTPAEIVKDLIAQNSDKLGRINYSGLARDIDSAKANFPELGAAIERETSAQLGPRAMARLDNASYTIKAKDGSTLTMSRNAPSVEAYFKGTANAAEAKTPEQRAALRKSDLAHYARLDQIFGDGNPKTFDGPKIQAGFDEALRTGSTFEQAAKAISARETAELNVDSNAASKLNIELGQLALDVIGIFDPTPTADLINAGISAWNGDRWGAFLSVVSAVPYVGDLAKLGKLGSWAKTISDTVALAAKNPAVLKMLEPALRKVSDLIGALPKAAFNALPDSAKTALLEMKGKIDGLLGRAGAKTDDVAVAVLNTVQRTFGQNSVKWATDSEGRLISASAVLKEVFPGLKRSPDEVAAQGRAAEKGIAGDHGGHAVPHRFLGDQGDINLFPQNGVPVGAAKNFNGSAFKTLENELADWVQAGGTVKYDVSFSDFVGSRPGTVEVRYKVLNKDGVEVFKNRDSFENQAGEVFNRVGKDFIQERLSGAAGSR
jgi:hypothetical protein